MKCRKCSKELDEGSKFCGECGTKVEESVLEISERGIDLARKVWFLLGFLRGNAMRGKTRAKWFLDFEKNLKLTMPEIWKDYESVIEFWREQAKENNG